MRKSFISKFQTFFHQISLIQWNKLKIPQFIHSLSLSVNVLTTRNDIFHELWIEFFCKHPECWVFHNSIINTNLLEIRTVCTPFQWHQTLNPNLCLKKRLFTLVNIFSDELYQCFFVLVRVVVVVVVVFIFLHLVRFFFKFFQIKWVRLK